MRWVGIVVVGLAALVAWWQTRRHTLLLAAVTSALLLACLYASIAGHVALEPVR